MTREVLGVINSLLSAIASADRNTVLALVPAGATVSAGSAASVAALAPAAAAAAVATLGAVIIAEGLELVSIIEEGAAVATLGAVSIAVSNLNNIGTLTQTQPAFGGGKKTRTATKTKRNSDCEECVKKRVFSQAARRKRTVAKILRRV